MFMSPGTCYVYQIYGVYYCLNISSIEKGAAILIRALEPLECIDYQLELRSKMKKGRKKITKQIHISNGPSKLCQAMYIEKEGINKENLIFSDKIWIEDNHIIIKNEDIVCRTRIGITYAEEWANKLLRFYIKGNKNISVN
ncbi:unnamed protein product [Gordionus sp. m RMFG-2023]